MAKAKTKPAEVRAPAPTGGARAGVLAIADIRPSPGNPRKSFPDESLADLAADIKLKGVLQRIIVRPIAAEGHPAPRYEPASGQWVGLDHFEIVAGERRWRAAQIAGLDRVPVDVREYSDEQSMLLAQISENDHREDVRPSEQAAAYRRLADAGRTAEQIAADTGKSLSFVRGLLRLGKLPPWALAAVDAGALPRATAELVARVPGEESRKRAAACVLQGAIDPRDLVGTPDRPDLTREHFAPLSYRDTKHVLQTHFTKELKGAPFSLTVLYGDLPACEPCPKRAGNDPEATADGTRADVCLDPDCYRAKLDAYRQSEIAAHAERDIEYLDTDERFAPKLAPKGYCDVTTDVWQTELHTDFPIGAKRRDESLEKLLGEAEVQRYMEFAADGKPRVLVKTADARKALQELKVLQRPERSKASPSTKAGPKAATAATKSGKNSGPSSFEVDALAAEHAARVLGEYGAEQFSELDDLEDSCANGPVVQGLRLVARATAYEMLASGRDLLLRVLSLSFPEQMSGSRWTGPEDAEALAVIEGWSAAKCLGFQMQYAAALELFDGPNTETASDLLAFAELDWPQLQEQARRELTGGEPAEAKLAKAEAEQEATPAATGGKKKGAKSK